MFKNLLAKLANEATEALEKFKADVNEPASTVENLLQYYGTLMTAGKKKQLWKLQDLREYLIERRKKQLDKSMQEKTANLQEIFNAGELPRISISVEWKKTRMWGNRPDATATFIGLGSYYGSAGGAGYDKESTAIAQAINQSKEFLKCLYTVKDANPDTDNRELFGYGSGYGILPYLEGGVGVSCYPRIFEKIGYRWEGVSHGKTYDAYEVTKK